MSVQPTQQTVEELYSLVSPCHLCPRECEVSRPQGEQGYCKVGAEPLVASAAPHYGEEPCLVGRGGSGTIFLGGCNLMCVFCQNYQVSHGAEGSPSGPGELADLMLRLQKRGCENINLVTPSHVVPWLMDAVRRARMDGLNVPLVYNSGGFDSPETLRKLDGAVDIYMPDFKFWSPEQSEEYCHSRDYPEVAREALKEMHRQVGDLQIRHGVARQGLLVRHMVMPNDVADTRDVLSFLAEEISPETHVNVMDQYRPCYRASEYADIAHRPGRSEVQRARQYAEELGLNLAG